MLIEARNRFLRNRLACSCSRPLEWLYRTKIYHKKDIMTFGTLLWKGVILTRAALLLRDIAGIGSAPYVGKGDVFPLKYI